MQSAELFEHQIGIEREELLAAPEEEAEELALIYQAKGLDPGAGASSGSGFVQDHEAALDTLAREELGIDPEEFGRIGLGGGDHVVSSLRWARSSPSCPISSSQGQQRSSSASC